MTLAEAKKAVPLLDLGLQLAAKVLAVEESLASGGDDYITVEVPAARWLELVKLAKRVGQ